MIDPRTTATTSAARIAEWLLTATCAEAREGRTLVQFFHRSRNLPGYSTCCARDRYRPPFHSINSATCTVAAAKSSENCLSRKEPAIFVNTRAYESAATANNFLSRAKFEATFASTLDGSQFHDFAMLLHIDGISEGYDTRPNVFA